MVHRRTFFQVVSIELWSVRVTFSVHIHNLYCFIKCVSQNTNSLSPIIETPIVKSTFLLYPATLISAGYYVIPSIQKNAFECPSVRPYVCPSVRPSVRPSVSASFSLSAWSIFQPIFFKLAMGVDIGKECPGIADG